jgi:hypothetical protein
MAGLIAQQKFHPGCSTWGASDDSNIVDELLLELETETGEFAFTSTADIKLRELSVSLVDQHWGAIDAVARALWEAPEWLRDFAEPETTWSPLRLERQLTGMRLVEILEGFEIHASIWDDHRVAD